MKAKVKGLWFLLLTQVLTLLGFQACDILGGRVEYGCPNVDYTIKGTVCDESGRPVEGIRVVVHRAFPPKDGVILDNMIFAKDTLYTDSEGKAGYSRNDFSSGIATVYLDDVDGEKNGEFESMTISDINAKQTKKGSGWYDGAYEASFDATLKAKEQ